MRTGTALTAMAVLLLGTGVLAGEGPKKGGGCRGGKGGMAGKAGEAMKGRLGELRAKILEKFDKDGDGEELVY